MCATHKLVKVFARPATKLVSMIKEPMELVYIYLYVLWSVSCIQFDFDRAYGCVQDYSLGGTHGIKSRKRQLLPNVSRCHAIVGTIEIHCTCQPTFVCTWFLRDTPKLTRWIATIRYDGYW